MRKRGRRDVHFENAEHPAGQGWDGTEPQDAALRNAEKAAGQRGCEGQDGMRATGRRVNGFSALPE